VGAGIESFATRERRRIRALTARRVPSEEILRQTVRAAYVAWFIREERAVSQAFDSLRALFSGEMQGALTHSCARRANSAPAVVRACGPPMSPNRGCDTASGLIQRPFVCNGCGATPHSRGWSATPRSTPVTGSALEHIQVHARRIRTYFAWRTGECVEEVCAHATERVASAIRGVESALRCAAELRNRAPEHGAARRAELAFAMASLFRLEECVRAISAAAVRGAGPSRSRLIRREICRDTPGKHQ
jgi:hypothetical protein